MGKHTLTCFPVGLCLSGGVYIQEPDACPASVDALVQLVNHHPGHFALGFAYGHISSKVVAVAGHSGRGLAAQARLEEWHSRKKLNKNVRDAYAHTHTLYSPSSRPSRAAMRSQSLLGLIVLTQATSLG